MHVHTHVHTPSHNNLKLGPSPSHNSPAVTLCITTIPLDISLSVVILKGFSTYLKIQNYSNINVNKKTYNEALNVTVPQTWWFLDIGSSKPTT